ncbi:NADH dehydrogenase [ubiquinone] 1 alpha subcomplex subunit 3-like [Ptychodera flava]|uniref:NADH dehydrogenase [ubiquinone] 1 alpha subcomplex subunit 3-like n=1 Tax=Ptychodera flava TaxID=63121 RepID=UPI00396A1651
MAAPQTFREALRRGFVPFFKHAWDREPVIVVSVAAGLAGPLLVYLSPLTKYAREGNAKMPWDYPVPIRYEAGKTGPPTSV